MPSILSTEAVSNIQICYFFGAPMGKPIGSNLATIAEPAAPMGKPIGSNYNNL